MQIVVNSSASAPAGSKPLPSQGNYYLNALTCLGCDAAHPPMADFLRLAKHLEGKWLIASPIHWEATHNDAMIVAANEELELSEEKARLLFSELAEFFKLHSIDSIYFDPYTWLLQVTDKPAINTKPLTRMLHQSMMPILNDLDKSFFWQRLLTELQMYLNAQPINTQSGREKSINGVWFWGEGEFNPPSNKKIITDDEVFLNFPSNESIVVQPLTDFTQFEKNHLVLIKHPDRINLSNLQKSTQNNKVQWYWNNLAYSQQPVRWWSRLWRTQ